MKAIPGSGIGIGATLMYFLDPHSGRRRRAESRQRVGRLSRRFARWSDAASRDAGNRAQGIAASIFTSARPAAPVPDEVLAARVKTRIGRLSRHPHAIEAVALAGRVELRGPILVSERRHLLEGVRRVPGVEQVEDRMFGHETTKSVPALQGGPERVPERRFEFMQKNWSPAARLAAGAAGAGLLGYGLAKRGARGTGSALGGSLVLARAILNSPMRRLLGIGNGPPAIDVHKTIDVAAPLEEVFGFFTSFENFPRFMGHVREVRRVDDGTWHWTVAGPAGIPLEWDAHVTRLATNELIAWKSADRAMVKNVGVARFEHDGHGGTRIAIHMYYEPPAGYAGHVVAKLLGSDPKKQMDDDLLRLKSMLEHGKATGAHGEVLLGDL